MFFNLQMLYALSTKYDTTWLQKSFSGNHTEELTIFSLLELGNFVLLSLINFLFHFSFSIFDSVVPCYYIGES